MSHIGEQNQLSQLAKEVETSDESQPQHQDIQNTTDGEHLNSENKNMIGPRDIIQRNNQTFSITQCKIHKYSRKRKGA